MSQEYDDELLDLVKQKKIYPYEYISDFERFEGGFPSINKFYSSFTGKNLMTKTTYKLIKFGINLR